MEILYQSFKISQRTEYSKIRVEDIYTKEDVTNSYMDLAKKILAECYTQLRSPEEYFEIENKKILRLKTPAKSAYFIYIPEGITEIGSSAFEKENFLGVHFPASLRKIDDFAFDKCVGLRSLMIPDTVQHIGYGVFEDCISLNIAILPKGLKSIPGRTFRECISLKTVVIPDTVEVIGLYAFSGCSLGDMNLPKNVVEIQDSAFENSGLKSVTLPETLKTIGDSVFQWCEDLEEISIPDSVLRIGSNAFAGCKNLSYVKLPKNIENLHSKTFLECESLKEIYLPDNIIGLSDHIFGRTARLDNINIPKNLRYIDGAPFSFSGIWSLTFNHDLKKLKTSLSDLLCKSNIEKLIIDKSVNTIDANAFKDTGFRIALIDYLGTEEEFNKFKKNNEKLFENLTALNKINFLGGDLEKSVKIEDLTR